MKKAAVKITDPWDSLKEFTAARIALGSVGNSIPLSQSLQLKLAHAHARDAIYSELDIDALIATLQHHRLPFFTVQSQAPDRNIYLKRPDLGRLLSEDSQQVLQENAVPGSDVCIILADGLSAEAINLNVVPLLDHLIPMFINSGLIVSPLCLATQARVALADHVAHALGAKFSIILIGERPGLSAADSIGAYLTYGPKPGLTDESRNCVSNIRPQGLPFDKAAQKIFYLVKEAFRLKLSGVGLKDNAGLLEKE